MPRPEQLPWTFDSDSFERGVPAHNGTRCNGSLAPCQTVLTEGLKLIERSNDDLTELITILAQLVIKKWPCRGSQLHDHFDFVGAHSGPSKGLWASVFLGYGLGLCLGKAPPCQNIEL